MCLITSTVQPLPNILYCCVSETAHLYQSGIVCKRAHSVGVSRLILVSVASPPTNTLIVLPPWPSINAGACPSVSYTRFCCRGCVPPLSRLGLICFTLSSFISTTKSYFECGGSILTERNSKNLNLIPRLILSSFPAAPSSEQLLETSLVVQGLRLCTPNAGGQDSTADQGTRSQMAQLCRN